MKRIHLSAAALCAAAALAATPLPASAVDTTVTVHAPAASNARTGDYRIVKRGPKVTRARCLEGGYVMVPSRGRTTVAERDSDIHAACKTVDYTK